MQASRLGSPVRDREPVLIVPDPNPEDFFRALILSSLSAHPKHLSLPSISLTLSLLLHSSSTGHPTPEPKMEIQNPRRILAVSLAEATDHLSRVLTGMPPPLAKKRTYPATIFHTPPPPRPKTNTNLTPPPDLTGTSPTPQPTLAGTTHPLPLTTPYYTATVPIWLDLVSDPTEWTASFLAPEAKEVLDALGGVVVVFDLATPSSDKAKSKALLEGVGHLVRTALGGWEWDGVLLAVGVEDEQQQAAVDEEDLEAWEDVCAEWGLEFIHHQRQGHGGKVLEEQEKRRNEYGERVGVARALEALQANDWASAGGGEEEGEEFGGFAEGGEDVEMDMDFLGQGGQEDFEGLRKAIWEAKEGGGGDEEMEDDEDVKKLERAMLKLQAVRDRGVGMTEEQRKRMAKQAVGEVMKEL